MILGKNKNSFKELLSVISSDVAFKRKVFTTDPISPSVHGKSFEM